jgi:hypothetical protein
VDPEDARSLTSVWTPHVPSRIRVDSNSVDFKQLNFQASRDPNVSSKLLNEKAKEMKQKQADEAKQCQTSSTVRSENVPSTADPNAVYGKATHCGTAMRDLMTNKFGNDGEHETTERYREYHRQRLAENRCHTTVKQTKSSSNRSASVQALTNQDCKEPFKLSKFKKIESRIKHAWMTTVP